MVTELTEWLKSIYSDLKVNRGAKHNYLEMDLDFSLPREVKISMIPYVNNILKDFPEELGKSVATPAGDHLFQVQEESEARRSGNHIPPHNSATVIFVFTSQKRHSDSYRLFNHLSKVAG